VDEGSAFILILLLLGSAYFSASETAFFSLSRLYLKKLENTNTAGSRRILGLLRKPRRLLITLLLGNTFVNMAISSFATLLALNLATKHGWERSGSITVQIILTTMVILLFGEIVPKLVAMSTADSVATASSLPLRAIQFLLFPVVWLFEKIGTLVSKKQAVDRYLGQRFTTEEFHNLIQSESSHHDLEDHEKRMLVGLFRFKEAEISEILVPRVKITAIEDDAGMDELRDLIISSGFSRIPVYHDSVDDIIGIVYVKDILLNPDKTTIADVMRPVWFVTENMKVQTLLNQFKARKTQMAVVVDEYGGTSGIITLEDILEEIVGEIHDEYDREEAPEIVMNEDGVYTVSGMCNIRQFNHEFSTDLDTDEYDNLAEYLLAHFNHVPETGEKYQLDSSLEFRVLESDGKSIKKIQVTVLGNA
jgi:CBS domain containing-hemolysin-like protein